MPTHTMLTAPQRRVVDYLRGTAVPVAAASVAGNIYGSQRSGVANSLRILGVLQERGLVRYRAPKGKPQGTGTGVWTLTAAGRKA